MIMIKNIFIIKIVLGNPKYSLYNLALDKKVVVKDMMSSCGLEG